jgi:rubrerythrin
MDDAARATARALFDAARAEADGYYFYSMAARSARDPKAKEVFQLLAAEELDHQEYLSAQYRSVLQTGKVDARARLGPRATLDGASPIFSDEIRGRLDEAHMEMSALSIGIQLELSSLTYYQGEAAKAADPAVKRLFEELAEWEKGHYQALLRQQQALKDDYWSANGFSPM